MRSVLPLPACRLVSRRLPEDAGTVGVGSAIAAGGQFYAELEAEVVRGQQPLPVRDELDVAQAGNGGSAYLVRCKRVGRGAVGAVAAVDVGHQQAKAPVCTGPVAQG